METSYAETLWDNFPVIGDRMGTSSEFSKEIALFMQRRSAIEKEYAAQLSKLYKTSKISDIGSLDKGWTAVMIEAQHASVWHQEFANSLLTDVRDPLLGHIKDTRKQRKTILDQGAIVAKELEQATDRCDKAKQKYEQQRQKQDRLTDEYEKATYTDQEAIIGKLAKSLAKESKTSEKFRGQYEKTVDVLQSAQRKMFESEMPPILKTAQQVEMKQYECIKSALDAFINLCSKRTGQATSYQEDMANGVSAISASEVIECFSKTHYSGKSKPAYAEVEKYDKSLGRCRNPNDPFFNEAAEEATSSVTSDAIARASAGSSDDVRRKRAKSKKKRGKEEEFTISRVNTPPAGVGGGGAPGSSSSSSAAGGGGFATTAAGTGVRPQDIIARARGLYDYMAQSPDQISFKEGDVINVLHKQDDGWWLGELNGMQGLFPCIDWVEEMPPPSPQQQRYATSSPTTTTRASHHHDEEYARCEAMYDFIPESEHELRLAVGDVLTMEDEDSGWYYGRNVETGEDGRFPVTYVRPI